VGRHQKRAEAPGENKELLRGKKIIGQGRAFQGVKKTRDRQKEASSPNEKQKKKKMCGQILRQHEKERKTQPSGRTGTGGVGKNRAPEQPSRIGSWKQKKQTKESPTIGGTIETGRTSPSNKKERKIDFRKERSKRSRRCVYWIDMSPPPEKLNLLGGWPSPQKTGRHSKDSWGWGQYSEQEQIKEREDDSRWWAPARRGGYA